LPYQVHERLGYVEVQLEGVIDSVAEFAAQLKAGLSSRNVLLNYAAVTAVTASSYSLAEQAREAERLGYRVATYAPRPALFGLSRQILQLGNVEEGVSASVFNDLEAARSWLTSA
jgi:hypothetical protein